MLQNAMPGEALVVDGVPAGSLKVASQNALPGRTLQEMAEKLDKSEAGRKKLRQAIGMLKEKVEANEKVLEINEILRHECEKERLRADSERNRAEEEKNLREKVVEDSHSTKELLVRALQRLDDVERNCKLDHNENERMRKEMKQVMLGLGGAVKAIEAAHSSFEGLEKNLLGKVNNALCASTKSSSLAETALSDAKRAQGTALAAEKLSQSLVSRIAVLEKQGASLDQRMTLLQQEIRMRKLEPLDNEQNSNGKRAPNGTSLAADKALGRGMVPSKYQQQAKKDCSTEGAGLSADVARAEGVSSSVNTVEAADAHAVGIGGSLSPKTSHGAEATGIPDLETLPESHAKDKLRSFPSAPVRVKADDSLHGMAALNKRRKDSSTGNTVREALDAARNKRNLSRTTSTSKLIPQPQKSSRCQGITPGTLASNATHASKECQVEGEEFRGRVQVLSGNWSMAALAKIERNDQIPPNVCVPHQTEGNRGSNAEGCPGRRPYVKIKPLRSSCQNGAETKLITGNSLLTEKEKGHNVEKIPVALLKEITKLFVKEKKSHAKVERKLDALRIVLQNSENDGVFNHGLVDGTLEKSKKRRRRRKEILEDSSKKTAYIQAVDEIPSMTCGDNHGVASLSKQVEGKVARGPVEGRGTKRKNNSVVIEKESAGPLPTPAKKVRFSGPEGVGKDVSEARLGCVQNSKDLDGPQFPDGRMEVPITPLYPAFDSLTTAAPEVMALTEGMDVDAENDTGGGLNGGWDTDSEMSECGFGEDWWTENLVLLSPTLPVVPPPSVVGEEADSNASLSWPKNLDDFSLFLDVLPPVEQEACDVDRTPATLPNIEDLKLRIENSQDIQSGVTGLSEETTKELQQAFSTETLSDVHSNRERSMSNIFVQCSESGSKPSDKSDDRVQDKEILVDEPLICSSSMSSGLSSEPSGYLPQDISVVYSGESEVVGRLAVDSETSKDDVLGDSQDVVKEEKLDAVHVKKVSPHSLELVLGGSAYERDANSTGSTMRQGPVISTVYTADKIIAAFGRTQNVLLGALIHTTDGDSGSNPAVATEIASLLASTVFKLDLMCMFTAIVVDSHALWDAEKSASNSTSKCKPLQLLIDIVKQVLATEIFQNALPQDQTVLLFAVQLQKFLIQGTIKPLSQATPDEALSDGHGTDNSFHFSAPSSKLKRTKALISGGKLLSLWCETMGKLDFLRHSIYSVLRFCDMDSHCLLATVSSFACVGCKSLFSADNDDVVGQAVQVVVSELIHDVDMERQTEARSPKIEEVEDRRMETQPCSLEGAEQSTHWTELLQNLKALRDVIGEEDGRSFEAFLPRLVELFHGVITATLGSQLKDNRHLFQRCLRTIACNEMKPNSLIAANLSDTTEQSLNLVHTTDVTCSGMNGSDPHIGEKDVDRSPVENYCWRHDTVLRPTQAMSQSESDVDLVEEWEQKFYDITNAVELVASHLGWEWTYNDFILEHLWKLVSPGASAITVACVAHMFGLLGRLGREVDSTELPGVDELRKSLLVVLSSDQTSSALSKEACVPKFPFRAQVAAAQALLVLSSFNRKDEITPCEDPEKVFAKSSELHAKSVKSLWNWVKASKLELQQVLPLPVRRALLSIDTSNFVPIF